MNRATRNTFAGLAASALILGGALASTAQADRGHHPHPRVDTFGTGQQVVATGLDNPRQLALGKHNAIHIAESGRGDDACTAGFCTGTTSRISALAAPTSATPRLSTVHDGMLSGANLGGAYSTGTHGVSVAPNGTVYAVNVAGSGDLTGTLFTVKRGKAKVVADLTAYEFANDPDGQGPESNPYAVLARGNRVLVADAASNDILSVDKKGRISVFAVLPNIETGACEGRPNQAGTSGCDFVPTALAEGPGNTVYVSGEVAGVAGEGVVWKLDHRGRVLQKWSGFDTPLGVAVEKDGTFYVSEMSAATGGTPGEVTRVKGAVRTSKAVPFPAGLAIIGKKLFVAAYGIAPSTGLGGDAANSGQVWRMNL